MGLNERLSSLEAEAAKLAPQASALLPWLTRPELVALREVVARAEERRRCIHCRERDPCPEHRVDAIEVPDAVRE